MSNLKFRKRPVVIEAIQWMGSNLREVVTFMDGEPYTKSHYASDAWDLYCRLVAKEGLKINTLEGMMNANVGDWIIKGVKGEHYPCKPDVFAMTYEEATQPAAGEPVYQCRKVGGCWSDCSKHTYDSVFAGDEFEKRILWSAPPAAAHGDEAVRKDAERYRWVRQPVNGNKVFAMSGNGECGGNMDAAIDQAMTKEQQS